MRWWYTCIDKNGTQIAHRPTDAKSVAKVVPKLLVQGFYDIGLGKIEVTEWRWSNRWKRFTIHDQQGGTHIIKQIDE